MAARTYRQRRLAWLTVGLGMLAALVGYPCVLPVFRDELQRYLGIGDDRFGLLFSLWPLTGCVMGVAGSVLVNRWGAAQVIRLTLWSSSVVLLLIGVAGAQWWAFAGGFGLLGFLAGAFTIALNVLLTRLFPRQRRRVLSLNLAITSATLMIMPLLLEGALALSRHLPAVRFAYILHGPFLVLAVVFCLATRWFRPRFHRSTSVRKSKLTTNRFGLLPPRLAWLAVLIALHTSADTALYIWVARYLGSTSFSTRPVVPGVVLAFFSLACLTSRLTLASIPESKGRHALLVLPGLLGGTILIAGILSHEFWLAAGGYVIGAACWAAEYPTQLSVAVQEDRDRFGAVLASAQVGGALLTLALAHGTGLLVTHLGGARMHLPMLLLASVFPLVGMGGALWWRCFPPNQPTGQIAPALAKLETLNCIRNSSVDVCLKEL